MRFALPFVLIAATSPVLAAVKEYWWNITYVLDTIPDGLAARRAVGVNGTWPPPPIEVNEDDYLVVHAHNSLDVSTSLHHHGMYFNSSSWMDGAVGVSECGIPPGGDFEYHIAVNESGQIGTYWWHAHDNGHYTDGLRAPLIIHALNETYKYDEEFTVVLGDWYHDEHSVLLKEFISIANPGGAEPVPDSGLIYFAQNGSYLGPISGTGSGGSSAATGFNENATLPFEPGKTYRLRVLNAGAFAAQWFWIDGHEIRIIEADGTDVQPYTVDVLQISVAQRYSLLVTARNDTSANWAVHSNFDTDMFDTVPDTLQPNMTASITYDSSAALTSNTIDAYTDTPDISLVPTEVIVMPSAGSTIELEVLFDTMSDGTNRAMFNMISYTAGLVPTVLSELTLGSNATTPGAYGHSNFVLDHLDTVDIVVKNGDAGKHPFHLHGHKYQIVNRADDYTSDDPTLNPPLSEGQTNPMRRDTIAIPSMGSATLRFVADNPGAWFFHCHIEWHLEAGLAVTLTEAPMIAQDRAQSVLAPPKALADNCAALGWKTSGNAAGHASATDLSGLPAGSEVQHNGWHAKGIAAMFGCVLAAVLGMGTAVWYALGGGLSDEEVEEQWRKKRAAKEARGKFFGLGKALGRS